MSSVEFKGSMNAKYDIITCDMHTGGEPLRIIISGYPELIGSTILDKIAYAKENFDEYRKFLMNEPRGHRDMYGAIVIKMPEKNKIGVIFLNNEGYSPMCGHGIIALGRYAIDYGLVETKSPETELIIESPAGAIKTFVEYCGKSSGCVRFESVPAFVYELERKIFIENLGNITISIVFGGGFYGIVSADQINVDLESTSLSKLIDIASSISEEIKKQIILLHPLNSDLAFLYGVIITDGKDGLNETSSTNVCVFADKQVDRSPTGTGVTARIALQWKKDLIKMHQEKSFQSIIGTSFTGKVINAFDYFGYDAVVVEVSGIAYYTGIHHFQMESNDPLGYGFKLDR